MIDQELRAKQRIIIERVFHALEVAESLAAELPSDCCVRVVAAINETKGKVHKEWMDI